MFNFFRRKGKNQEKETTQTNYVPFIFDNGCYLASFGHYDEYSFDVELTDFEKAILTRIFNFLHKRLNILIQNIQQYKISETEYKQDDQKLIKTLYEVCFFDFPKIVQYLESKNCYNKNTGGAFFDTIRWTFNKYQLFGNNHYPVYRDLETDKIDYYTELYQSEESISSGSQYAVDRIYFKIIEKPCSPYKIPKISFDATVIKNKFQFLAILLAGQKQFLSQLYLDFDVSTVDIKPRISQYFPYMKEEKKVEISKSSLEDFAYQLSKLAIQNNVSETDKHINAFLSSEISTQDRQLLKQEIKYLMISLNQFFIYSYEAVEVKRLNLKSENEITRFQLQLSLGIERAFLLQHSSLDLSYENFKDRYGKYTIYLGEYDYKDFRKSFVLAFVGQLQGVFTDNCYNIEANQKDLISIGSWIYTVWTEFINKTTKGQYFEY